MINNKKFKTDLTTPDCYLINFYLNEMVKSKVRYCFMEVSSHSIDQKRISNLDFNLGVFTNISHDHINYHKTFKNYIYTKKKFFDTLSKESYSLINIDDKNSNIMIQNTESNIKTFSLKKLADFNLKLIENNIEGLVVKLDGKLVHTQIPGKFNAYNLLCIYSVAVLLDQDIDDVLKLYLVNAQTKLYDIKLSKLISLQNEFNNLDLLNVKNDDENDDENVEYDECCEEVCCGDMDEYDEINEWYYGNDNKKRKFEEVVLDIIKKYENNKRIKIMNEEMEKKNKREQFNTDIILALLNISIMYCFISYMVMFYNKLTNTNINTSFNTSFNTNINNETNNIDMLANNLSNIDIVNSDCTSTEELVNVFYNMKPFELQF